LARASTGEEQLSMNCLAAVLRFVATGERDAIGKCASTWQQHEKTTRP
jgi:hypothetical protein